MKINNIICFALLASLVICSCGQGAAEDTIRVLLLSGQNNHNWKASTPVLKEILEETGCMKVTVDEHPEKLTAEKLKPFRVIVSNWNAYGKGGVKEWPEETRNAYVDFVRNGGGHVVVHAGSSSFYDWDDYHKICLATWKGGQTKHGPVHEFKVRVDKPEHSIVKGLAEFRHTDELWCQSGVQPDAVVIASAYADPNLKNGTGNWEPVLLVGQFGKGRTFATMLGHVWKDGKVDTLMAPEFRLTFARGVEWAAGK